MLSASDLLNALSQEDDMGNYKNYNNDNDLGEVLEAFHQTTHPHKLRYSNGEEKVFLF